MESLRNRLKNVAGSGKDSIIARLKNSLSDNLNRKSGALTEFCSLKVTEVTKQLKSDYEKQVASLKEELKEAKANCS